MEEPEINPALQAAADIRDKQKAIDDESREKMMASLQQWDEKVKDLLSRLQRNIVNPPSTDDENRLDHCLFYFPKPTNQNENIS